MWLSQEMNIDTSTQYPTRIVMYEGWNFNFGNTPLDWIQELLE